MPLVIFEREMTASPYSKAAGGLCHVILAKFSVKQAGPGLQPDELLHTSVLWALCHNAPAPFGLAAIQSDQTGAGFPYG